MVDAVIVSTARTALTKSWRGAFNLTHGATLGGHVVQHAIARAGISPDQVEDELMGKIPERYLTRAHHWLILHGRYTCIARRPKCEACLIADLCPSRELFLGA